MPPQMILGYRSKRRRYKRRALIALFLVVGAVCFFVCSNSEENAYNTSPQYAFEPYGHQVMKPDQVIQHIAGPKVASWRFF